MESTNPQIVLYRYLDKPDERSRRPVDAGDLPSGGLNRNIISSLLGFGKGLADCWLLNLSDGTARERSRYIKIRVDCQFLGTPFYISCAHSVFWLHRVLLLVGAMAGEDLKKS